LDIAQAPRQAEDLPNHPKTIKGLYITGDFGADSDGIEFRRTNGTQGIGFGYNTIYAAGSNPDQVLQLKPKGAAALRVLGKANLSPGNDENDFSLEDSMESGSLTIGSVSKSYGGQNGQVFNLAGLLLQTNGKTEIAVYHPGKRFSSLMYYEGGDAPLITIGRDMGTASDWRVTPVNIASNLTVNGNLTVGGGVFLSNLNYSIELSGSAFDSDTPDGSFLKVNNIDMGLNANTGLNTMILNFDGSYKAKATHVVFPDATQWNEWAKWVNDNAAFGDIVAVASHDAINNVPAGEAAALLNSIQATNVSATVPAGTLLPRAPYALLFVKGRLALEIVNSWLPKGVLNPNKPKPDKPEPKRVN